MMNINGRKIGPGQPAYIIAEMSANHNQDFDQAVEIMKAAKNCGADAIKIQTYTADTITINCDNEYFRIKDTIWNGRTLYDLYKEAYTPWEWQPKLKEMANKMGLDLFSSPFDESAVDFLEKMEVPAYKIASFENVDFQLLRKVAATGKPIIMSTGMANLNEIEDAVKVLKTAGTKELALLKCTSAYPAPMEDVNLLTIPFLAEKFSVPVGLSDHTLGITVPIASVALGACIIEKHFTLSRAVPGPDSKFSLEPEEFTNMVNGVRAAEKALGKVSFELSKEETKSLQMRRSLFVVQDIRKGEKFSKANVRSIRPAWGLHTRHFEEVLGREAVKDIKRGTPLSFDLVQKYN